MEALVVLGLVPNIAQFVGFADVFVSKTREIYKSGDGVLKAHLTVLAVTEDTKTLTDKLYQSQHGSLNMLRQRSKH